MTFEKNNKFFFQFVWIIIFFCILPLQSYAFEINTNYSTIIYKDQNILKKINNELYMGSLRYYMPGGLETIEDELKAKVDIVAHRVQNILEMYPKHLHFKIFILENKKQVQETYFNLYNHKKKFIAFYSPKMNAVYISPQNLNVNVLAHEIGHVVVENYFEISPPVKIHELLAQFSERHLGN